MSFYEQNDSGLSPSAYDLPLPSGDSAPDSNYRFNINKFKLTTPKIEATVENVIKFRDELERAFGAMNIHDYLELPEYVPPDLNLTYPVINHTSQADNIPDLADEVVRKVEDLMIENANRLSREVLFYKTKNGWYPWEEGHYKRPMVCIDDIVQPMPDEMLYPEPRLVETPKAEEDLWEKRLRELEMTWTVFQELARRFMRFTDACLAEDKKEETAPPTPNISPPSATKKSLLRRALNFAAKYWSPDSIEDHRVSEGFDDYCERNERRRNVMDLDKAKNYIYEVAALPDADKEKLYQMLKGHKPEDIYFDDKNLYTLLTLCHGVNFTIDFVEYREEERKIWRKTLPYHKQIKDDVAKLQQLNTNTPHYKEIRDSMEPARNEITQLENSLQAKWDNFVAAHSFVTMIPNTVFRISEDNLGKRWADALLAPEVNTRLQAYAMEIQQMIGPALSEQECTVISAKLLEMLRYATATAGIKGNLHIEKFVGNPWANGFTKGDNIYFNSIKFFDGEKINFTELLNTLFHEAAHVRQNDMLPLERIKNFGLNQKYYMDDSASITLYKLQGVESDANYLGAKADAVTAGWPPEFSGAAVKRKEHP